MSSYQLDFSDWVGKKIESCYINDSKRIMRWKVDGKCFKIEAVGDCCSYSWFEHCDNGEALQDAVLNSFENVSEGSIHHDEGEDNDYYRDQILVNMLKFKTNKGYCTIEFRNSSNGYYSGWCEISEVKNVCVKDFALLGDF